MAACTSSNQQETASSHTKLQEIVGETQGTTYGIKIVDGPTTVTKKEIDSILHDFDLSLSGYIPESTVSQLNNAVKTFAVSKRDPYFTKVFYLSERLKIDTEGAFDPTVYPLMELWGFLKNRENIPTDQEIDSVMQFVGWNEPENFSYYVGCGESKANVFVKKDPRVKLDFNAIAQGYSVDVLADFLRKKGCKNFYVEIGGEIYVEGKNPDGKAWRLGVDKPVATNDGKKQRVISAVISVSNKGIATSGNYRKFYKKGGKIFAHTLDPKSGRPAENELLSATVVAKSAAIADGMATAFMVMGLQKSKEYLKSKDKDGLEVLFIYTDEEKNLKSYVSEGMKEIIE